MSSQRMAFLVSVMLLWSLKVQSQIPPQTLFVGHKAPPLVVQAWLKGEPITSFERGHVYVLEFGNVNCGPCRAAIPHMATLVDKYKGRATFISIYTWEEQYKRLKLFLDRMGESINSAVALDHEQQQTMNNTWMRPAHKFSIPTAFVVDQMGNIAWIGHPMDLDPVVGSIIEGAFHSGGKTEELGAFYKRIEELKDQKNFKTALDLTDSMIYRNPHNKFLYREKMQILQSLDERTALKFGWEILNSECRNTESVLTYVAKDLLKAVEATPPMLKNSYLDLIIAMAERAAELSSDETITSNILQIKIEAKEKKSIKSKG